MFSGLITLLLSLFASSLQGQLSSSILNTIGSIFSGLFGA